MYELNKQDPTLSCGVGEVLTLKVKNAWCSSEMRFCLCNISLMENARCIQTGVRGEAEKM